MNIITELKKRNIRAKNYSRPPFGKNIFALSIQPSRVHPEGIITVHPGSAKIKVHGGSRKHKQLAMTVTELGRTVKRHIRHTLYQDNRPEESIIRRFLINHFGVVMPHNTVWTVTDIKVQKHEEPSNDRPQALGPKRWWVIEGNVKAVVKNKTVNHFLMGLDERHNFICALPHKPKSVQHAHRMLKPSELRSKHLRQGEWFFEPCNKMELMLIRDRVRYNPGQIRQMRLGGKTHVAKCTISMNSVIYARGYVIDMRMGHHKALHLDTWHRVQKNKESEIKVSPEQKQAAQRMTRTWD